MQQETKTQTNKQLLKQHNPPPQKKKQPKQQPKKFLKKTLILPANDKIYDIYEDVCIHNEHNDDNKNDDDDDDDDDGRSEGEYSGRDNIKLK